MNLDLALLVPECAMLLLVAVLFVQALSAGPVSVAAHRWLPLGALAVTAATVVGLPAEGMLLWDAYKVDALSQFFKLCVAGGFCIAVLNATRQPTLEEGKRADYFLFLGVSAWGLMLLASSAELVTLYLALELSSYSLYVLIPLRGRTREGAEAGVKYILFGAAATAISLYGLSYIMAAQQTTYIAALAARDWSWAASPMAVVGLSLFLCGMFYKLALFPFHFWCPDVYQGASNETAAYVATLPKLGAVVVLVRLAAVLHPGLEVTTAIAWLGVISMTFGNLCALAQKDVKRMLGFSSVAHAGYVTVGLVSGTAEGLAAAAFYALVYVVMNLLCFWVVSRVAVDGRNLVLSDLNGLHRRSPVLAFALGVGAFALVGLPPTAGFMGKLFLITAAWNHGYNWLVIALALNSAIAIYYYLSLVRHAYTEPDENASLPAPDQSAFSLGGAVALAAATLVLGIVPAPLFEKAVKAGMALFG